MPLILLMPSPGTFSDSLLSPRWRPNQLPWLSHPSQAVLSLPVLGDPHMALCKPSTAHRHLPHTRVLPCLVACLAESPACNAFSFQLEVHLPSSRKWSLNLTPP